MCCIASHLLLSSQIEDLSQQAHKAAAEKFKVPVTSSPLAPPVPPSLTIKEESEEEEEEVLTVLTIVSEHLSHKVCRSTL